MRTIEWGQSLGAMQDLSYEKRLEEPRARERERERESAELRREEGERKGFGEDGREGSRRLTPREAILVKLFSNLFLRVAPGLQEADAPALFAEIGPAPLPTRAPTFPVTPLLSLSSRTVDMFATFSILPRFTPPPFLQVPRSWSSACSWPRWGSLHRKWVVVSPPPFQHLRRAPECHLHLFRLVM